MGVPLELILLRRRQPITISASARWATISLMDHLAGGGALRNCAGVSPRTSRASLPGVAACTVNGFLPSDKPSMSFCAVLRALRSGASDPMDNLTAAAWGADVLKRQLKRSPGV